jgi:hypothetical protein
LSIQCWYFCTGVVCLRREFLQAPSSGRLQLRRSHILKWWNSLKVSIMIFFTSATWKCTRKLTSENSISEMTWNRSRRLLLRQGSNQSFLVQV